MTTNAASHARLWVLLARSAPVGVILRRGPSKQVQLIKWRTADDSFEYGQWFKGRVFERNCDLSPDGELLISFAANYKEPLYSWTAVSRPPYFTALAPWPKGDSLDGGGWFVDDRTVHLNHHSSQSTLHPNFGLGPLTVAGSDSGWLAVGSDWWTGRDHLVWDLVRRRDGWTRTETGKRVDRSPLEGWDWNPPDQWQKVDPRSGQWTLGMDLVGTGGKGLPWYQVRYSVRAGDSIVVDLGLADWGDWDHRGDLVFAKDGSLFRQTFRASGMDSAVRIADFDALKFQNVPPPAHAQQW